MALKKKIIKVAKEEKKGTQKETLLYEIERDKKQAFKCINASMNYSEQTTTETTYQSHKENDIAC